MLSQILSLISLFVMMFALRTLVEVFPSLMACLIRAKESINLEASVQLSRGRNILSVCLALPFFLVVWQRELYMPSFMDSLDENLRFCVIIGIFLTLVLLRMMLERIMKPKTVNSKTYATACKTDRTFFSLLTLILLAMGGIMSIFSTPADVVTSAMLWVSAAIYLIYIRRKTQILTSSASFFASFLYLCALDLIPTGAVVASAIIF
ncbi:MAG: DUF4271 domain-containing protein [Bacteroidales bacterium]|nr:DUF4271 domain-containing protein [Bacteroidales bacterium]